MFIYTYVIYNMYDPIYLIYVDWIIKIQISTHKTSFNFQMLENVTFFHIKNNNHILG